jgi:hypothetical protein
MSEAGLSRTSIVRAEALLQASRGRPSVASGSAGHYDAEATGEGKRDFKVRGR